MTDQSARLSVRTLQAINRFYVRSYHRLEVLTPWRLPAHGPAIVVSNHTSGLDPELIQSCGPLLIHWMMAREYYDQPILRNLLDRVGVIPVNRDGRDMAATRAGLRTLHDGKLLGIFPEGRIETADEIIPFQTGVALMAVKSRAPVYPVYLDGTQRTGHMGDSFFTPQNAMIAFGPPILFDRRTDELEVVTHAIQAAVESLCHLVRKTRRQRGF